MFLSQNLYQINIWNLKPLSNQKFKDFTEKFPEISFGILTGDIKSNPEADCLIMTTEILRNTLFQKKSIKAETLEKDKTTLHFEMDIENELACVVFDEVHYINDKERGKIWEETILPKLEERIKDEWSYSNKKKNHLMNFHHYFIQMNIYNKWYKNNSYIQSTKTT